MLALLFALTACDDTFFGISPDVVADDSGGGTDGSTDGGTDSADDPGVADGFCGVLELFAAQCLLCHGAAVPSGGLDLETDPHGALVGAPSAYPGRTLVVAGDPDASFLYVKITGTQDAGEGGPMPPTGELDPEGIERVRAWIGEGATPDCESGVDTGITPRALPPGGLGGPRTARDGRQVPGGRLPGLPRRGPGRRQRGGEL